METYNLTFSGEILPGHDPWKARIRFGKAMGIDDAGRLQAFFSGEVITLRRNLDLDAAQSLQQRMAKIGIRLTRVCNSGQIHLDLSATESPPVTPGPTPPQTERKAPLRPANSSDSHGLAADSGNATNNAGPVTDIKPPPRGPVRTNKQHSKRYIVGGLVRPINQPNLFTLKPFRNSARIQARTDKATGLARGGLWLGIFALLALLLLSVRFLILPASAPLPQLEAIATAASGRLAAASREALYLLDRSGRAERSLALGELHLSFVSSMVFDGDGMLLVVGSREETGTALWRCQPFTDPAQPCTLVLPNVSPAAALAVDTNDRTIFLADPASSTLFRLDPAGQVVATAAATVAPEPVLAVRDGLLYLNHPEATLLQILRPDIPVFGQLLDQLLLLPAGPDSSQYLRITGLAPMTDDWWVLLDSRQGDRRLFRFDATYGPGRQVNGNEIPSTARLAPWQDRLLVYGIDSEISRYAADGSAQLPLEITTLRLRRNKLDHQRELQRTLWGSVFLGLALLASLGIATAAYQRLRSRVYQPGWQRGAQSIENDASEITWVPGNTGRSRQARRLLGLYCAVAAVLLATAALAQTPMVIVAALLIMVCGPAAALMLLATFPTGHIGRLRNQLLVVDHHGRYHLGEGARIQYRNHFVLIDDVLVFLGTRLLPSFDSRALRRDIQPLVTCGVRIQRRAIAVRLFESRHPLSLAMLVMAGGLLLGLFVIIVAYLL